MRPRLEHPITVFRRRDDGFLPINDRRLRRSLDAGTHVRVVAGSFAATSHWAALTPIDRHFVRVLETGARVRGPVVFSHFAAAAIWDIDLLGPWPEAVDVRIERAGGGRSTGGLRRRAWGFDGVDVEPWGAHFVTGAAQTVVDLARELSPTGGVIAMDRALWCKREGGALTTKERLRETVAAQAGSRGLRRAEAAAEFASGLSDSVRESQSRVAIHRLGFPVPVLQRRFVLPSGRVAHPDFFFEDFEHGAEFDGTGKYLDPALLRGRTPESALLEEKDRGDELRRQMRALSRWRTPALRDVRRLYDILVADGLPSRAPRPRTGVRFA